MIKVFYGNDTVKVRENALSFIHSYIESEGANLQAIEPGNYESGILKDALGGVSLFGDKKIFLIDTPSDDVAFNEEVKGSVTEMVESKNVFVVIEKTLLAADKKVFKGAEMEEFKKGEGERFNNFALSDALADKDKRKLWLLFNEARSIGTPLEEISGVLWWQLKTLRLAALTESANAAGLKDYPYNKAKRSLAKFAPGELEKLSRSLHTLLHESRLGHAPLDLALEHWILSL